MMEIFNAQSHNVWDQFAQKFTSKILFSTFLKTVPEVYEVAIMTDFFLIQFF